MFTTHNQITKAIIRSQHCQRNWDLTKSMPEDDLNLLITAATQCPSKQNVAFYQCHFITNREIIEAVHETTRGFTTRYIPYEAETNSQTLANLLIVFEEYDYRPGLVGDIHRSDETRAILNNNGIVPESIKEQLKRDREMAVGIAAGYLNLTASILGYGTGCCLCFDNQKIKDILDMNGEPLLLMGIGFKNSNLNRRVHHVRNDFIFPTKAKQEIPVKIVS